MHCQFVHHRLKITDNKNNNKFVKYIPWKNQLRTRWYQVTLTLEQTTCILPHPPTRKIEQIQISVQFWSIEAYCQKEIRLPLSQVIRCICWHARKGNHNMRKEEKKQFPTLHYLIMVIYDLYSTTQKEI